MNAHARWQELIAENISSASVPAYRKQQISFSAVEAGLDANATGINSPRYVIPSSNISTNFLEGEVRSTGAPLDFAIDGPAMFEIQMPDGSKAYTRDGQFEINSQGQLITKQGYNVMSDTGPVQLDTHDSAPIAVSPSGEISQGGTILGHMRIVEFPDPHLLESVGQGYFAWKQDVPPSPNVVASSIRQGFLEASNASVTLEMSNLVLAMRMFESNQRVLQMQDERMGKAIAELGNPM